MTKVLTDFIDECSQFESQPACLPVCVSNNCAFSKPQLPVHVPTEINCPLQQQISLNKISKCLIMSIHVGCAFLFEQWTRFDCTRQLLCDFWYENAFCPVFCLNRALACPGLITFFRKFKIEKAEMISLEHLMDCFSTHIKIVPFELGLSNGGL